ncbi:MAG: helicase C-terminal domain-containing protein, partial [Candidatus Hadarchaeia archaeon]
KKSYGESKGVYYGYIVPALRRASQALGRMLRSEDDRGIFVLGDERYGDRRFFRLLPDYIRNNTKPTNQNRIGSDIKPWARKILK